jgi:hypothetical protein
MQSQNHNDPLYMVLTERIAELERELRSARWDIIHLMPWEMTQLLTNYHDCVLRADFGRWMSETINRIAELAETDPEASRYPSQPRGYCPLCKHGSLGPFDLGFVLPDGLKRHLEGHGTAHQCRVTAAAFRMAETALREKFRAAEEAAAQHENDRRKTETLFVTEPGSPPKLSDEWLWGDKPRDSGQLAEARQRLSEFGFEIETSGNVIEYRLIHGACSVLADPRAMGKIRFCVFRTEKAGKRSRRETFTLPDSWKKDIANKIGASRR